MAAGTLTPNDPPFIKMAPVAGPRHFMFHPSGKFGYTNNEINSRLTLLNPTATPRDIDELLDAVQREGREAQAQLQRQQA